MDKGAIMSNQYTPACICADRLFSETIQLSLFEQLRCDVMKIHAEINVNFDENG